MFACTERHPRRRASFQSVRTRDSGASGKEEKPWRTERRPTITKTDETGDDASQMSGLSSTGKIVTAWLKRSSEGCDNHPATNDDPGLNAPLDLQPRTNDGARSPVVVTYPEQASMAAEPNQHQRPR